METEMTDNSKLIHEWQNKVKHSFDDEGKLHDYLLHTLDNFLYRYLETSIDKDLKTQEIAPFIYGAHSFESNMVQALKISNIDARNGIKELAKTIPKAEEPKVKYTLQVQLKELTPEKGHLIISAIVNWDFPHYVDRSKMMKKDVEFKYSDLGQFRKELALKLESACELFN
jgi:hypothetical protein